MYINVISSPLVQGVNKPYNIKTICVFDTQLWIESSVVMQKRQMSGYFMHLSNMVALDGCHIKLKIFYHEYES